MHRVVVTIIGLVAACALFVGLHPVSPARTYDAYEHKAKDTAESVLSSVETANLTAHLASRHRLFPPYASVTLSEADAGIGGAADTFDGVQPPDARADRVRAELRDLIARASDTVSTLRIRARRGDTDALAAEAEPLAAIASDLNAFIEAHS